MHIYLLGMLGFYTPFVYLPALATNVGGISVEDANFLISIIGILDTTMYFTQFLNINYYYLQCNLSFKLKNI